MINERLDLEQEIKELIINLETKGQIELTKINTEKYSKKVITYINEFINIYIKLNSFKSKKRMRNIDHINNYFEKTILNIQNKYKIYKTKNKSATKAIILLIYLLIYRYQISTIYNINIDSSKKFHIIKKLYKLLRSMSSIISKVYISKIICLSELGLIIKMLIIFSMNNDYKSIKENSDLKNLMYFKETLNILFIIFNDKSDEIEKKFLIDIFHYINNNFFSGIKTIKILIILINFTYFITIIKQQI